MQDQTIQWLSVILGSLLFLDACRWVATRHVFVGRVGGCTSLASIGVLGWSLLLQLEPKFLLTFREGHSARSPVFSSISAKKILRGEKFAFAKLARAARRKFWNAGNIAVIW